jgi:hypothetical protein
MTEPPYHAPRYAHAHYLSNPEHLMTIGPELAFRASLGSP